MTPSQTVLDQISAAAALLKAASRGHSGDRRLGYVRSELDRIHALVIDHWPLTVPEKQSIQLGLFAVRELEGTSDDLALALEELDYALTR